MVRPTLKVTLNCMRCATRQFRWKILQISVLQYDKLTALLDLQYRSEISGQRTRKTHAQFLRKRVLKNACGHAHLRGFDARVFFCYSLA